MNEGAYPPLKRAFLDRWTTSEESTTPPDVLADVERRVSAEYAEREAQARAAVAEKVRAALLAGLRGQAAKYPGFRCDSTTSPDMVAVDGILTVSELAVATTDVFVELLRNPPAFVTHSDGHTEIEWPDTPARS